MDSRAILDQLLKAGQNLAAKGQAIAEEKLGVPDSGPERDAMVSGLGKGAAAAGVLAVLLGTGAGRRLTGTGIKLGSLAALGTLGYQAYKNWQGTQSNAMAGDKPVHELTGAEAEYRSLALIKAMIAAAKADGHIDDDERTRIQVQIQQLPIESDVINLMQAEIAKPLNVQDVAQSSNCMGMAVELYLASWLVIDDENDQERAYLENLAQQLKLDSSLVAQLKQQAQAN
jgi:uncharacterized membrane protein YebE (DUF533 family)